jgi:3D (Asp-Asp-Asp) domain-containing protein
MVLRCDVQSLGILNAKRDSLDVLDPGLSPDFLAHGSLARGDRLAQAERVVMAEVTQVAVDEGGLGFASPMDEEVIDVGINRGDTATGSTGDLFWLTTYTCEEGYCGFTANNVQVAPGMAACSDDWPFGTVFLIAGQWEVVCQDRGSGVVLPNHLDVFFDTAEEAAAWLAQVGDHAEVEVR